MLLSNSSLSSSGAKARSQLDILEVLILLAWLENELYLRGVGMGSCTLPAGALRGPGTVCASPLEPPRPGGAAARGLLCCKNDLLTVLTYSNIMNGRRRTETGPARFTAFSLHSVKILGACGGFHFL